MAETKRYPEHMVFGLDIGTRSIVGSVGYMDRNKFNMVAHYVKEHDTRAMMDGQIHDIQKVGETIEKVKKELEIQIERPLTEVCIAAAGRVLKTQTVHVEVERTEDVKVTSEEIYSLDLLGVENAYDIVREENKDEDFFCVGYTVVRYYMNDYVINNLEGHIAKKIGADVLVTFLPSEVVEGLNSAVELANLQVANLTLEPIAAINIAIPEQFRLLNIALVDVGAGTSDISITKDGSIIAYGMIPRAGDEITESIVHKCLVDFNTAEDIKLASLKGRQINYQDIMMIKQKATAAQIRAIYKDIVDTMTSEIADKIKELNGGKSVNAVFIVGGGGKAFGFTQSLAKHLGLAEERVALRGEEVLGDVNFLVEGVEKDPLLVTPIGICINFYNQKNNFIFVNINGHRVKLYDNDKLTVVDAAIQGGLSNMDLFPKRGKELTFTVNKMQKTVRGLLGEPATIKINGRDASMNSKIVKNDKIDVIASTIGEDAKCTIEQLPEYKNELTFIVNDKKVECPKVAKVNGNIVTSSYEINQKDEISIPDYYTLEDLLRFVDINLGVNCIKVNGHTPTLEEPIYQDFKIIIDTNMSNVQIEDENEDVFEEESTENDEAVVTNEESSKQEVNEVKNDAIVENAMREIFVTVNEKVVGLNGKTRYSFVDILDFYPFDTRTMGGTELIIKINGETSTFADAIEDGDNLELYWV